MTRFDRTAQDIAPRFFWAGRTLRLAITAAAVIGAYWFGTSQIPEGVRGPIILPPGPKVVDDRLVGETEVKTEKVAVAVNPPAVARKLISDRLVGETEVATPATSLSGEIENSYPVGDTSVGTYRPAPDFGDNATLGYLVVPPIVMDGKVDYTGAKPH